jgi:membrane protease YdiL (CAAX protease family)
MFWLLTRLRLIRLLNLTGTFGRLSTWRKKQGRLGTAKKSKAGPIVGIFVTLVMLFGFGSMAQQSVRNLHGFVDVPQVYRQSDEPQASNHHSQVRLPAMDPGQFSPGLVGAVTGLLILLLLVSIFVDLGARELAKPEWDMEWLVTLPIALKTLLWARIVGRSASNAFGMVAFVPLCVVLAWYSGFGWFAPVIGLIAALPLSVLSALGRTLADVGLRLSLSPPKLRNLQALMSVLGMAGMYLVFSLSTLSGAGYGFTLASSFPLWATWSPPGLLVLTLNTPHFLDALLYALALVVQTLLLVTLGVTWMRHQLRQGLVAAGSRETVGAAGRVQAGSHAPGFSLFKSALQRRELTLLGRDRNFLIQTLLLPVVTLGGQFAINGGIDSLTRIWSSPAFAASTAFGVASYMLMLSAFQTINTEGAALWLLYSFPRSIGGILKEKAQLWAVLALVYPLLILLPGWFYADDAGLNYLGHAVLALIGVPIYAVIAVALGVFASDPMAQEQGARIRPKYLYLFMLLSGFYGYGIWAAVWWQSLEIVLLAALLAIALWQKAADQLPYLLDPATAPPARVSASDGLIAAMMFLVFQIVIAAIWHAIQPKLGGAAVLASFVGSGALTYGLVRLVYWRSKTEQIPTVLRGAQSSSWLIGASAGMVAASIGLVYIWVVQRFGVLSETSTSQFDDPTLKYWLVALAILAAPIFEEFIFRGLIFGGLRRSMGLMPAAAASAAVFAVVHPPASIIPVFFLGLCTALAYDRSRVLAAPMLTHAVYNAVVLGYQYL